MSPSHDDVTSTCSGLPDEILREIFICCVTGDDEAHPTCLLLDKRKGSIRDLPQLSVSRVCSSWRQVALHTPQLWNVIWIYDVKKVHMSIAREWLSRARNLPISIKFHERGRGEQNWRSEFVDFLSSYRLQTVSITTKEQWFHQVLSNLPQSGVTDLKSIKIFRYYSHNVGFIHLDDMRYPNLTAIHLDGEYKISGNSSTLRIFDGRHRLVTIAEGWDLLRRCPSLREAHIMLKEDSRPASVPLIDLQSLQVLSLHSENRIYRIPFTAFIEALTLPSIEELHVHCAEASWSATAFQALAHRSDCFPHLVKLDLERLTSDVDAGALLALMPSVTNISLCHRFPTKDVRFDQLALGGLASGSLAPRLQSLVVGYVPNATEFLGMVELRMKNGQRSSNGIPASFTGVEFISPEAWFSDERYRVHTLRQRGIPIRTREYRLWRALG